MISDYLQGDKIKKNPVKKLSKDIGIEAIGEIIENSTGEEKLKIREWLMGLGFNKYIYKRLKSSKKDQKIFLIKIIGNLRLEGMEEILKNEIYQNKDSVDIQYFTFEVLAKLGYDDILFQIFNDESIYIHLTYRAFQSILTQYSGNKISFYKKMLQVKDKYVIRIIIKVIGQENIYELGSEIKQYMCDESKDMRIAAINTLGELKCKECYEELKSLCKDKSWQIRSAAIKAIGQIDLEASVDTLMEGLMDSEWWVRYNSADILVRSKDIDNIFQEVIDSNDRFAKEILNNAIEKSKIEGCVKWELV